MDLVAPCLGALCCVCVQYAVMYVGAGVVALCVRVSKVPARLWEIVACWAFKERERERERELFVAVRSRINLVRSPD